MKANKLYCVVLRLRTNKRVWEGYDDCTSSVRLRALIFDHE